MTHDRRAVSSSLSYVLVVAITLTLTTGLVVGAEELVDSQREQVASDQLDVVGQRLAATIMTVDRFGDVDGNPDRASVTREFPRRIAGSQYRIRTVQDAASSKRATLYLEATGVDVNVSFSVRAQSADEIEETRLNGGSLRVVYDNSRGTDRLVIENV